MRFPRFQLSTCFVILGGAAVLFALFAANRRIPVTYTTADGTKITITKPDELICEISTSFEFEIETRTGKSKSGHTELVPCYVESRARQADFQFFESRGMLGVFLPHTDPISKAEYPPITVLVLNSNYEVASRKERETLTAEYVQLLGK
ncbi:MAG: hypothetical protein AAF483_05280 [Planctomycetota bacterium]